MTGEWGGGGGGGDGKAKRAAESRKNRAFRSFRVPAELLSSSSSSSAPSPPPPPPSLRSWPAFRPRGPSQAAINDNRQSVCERVSVCKAPIIRATNLCNTITAAAEKLLMCTRAAPSHASGIEFSARNSLCSAHTRVH